jgi:hypothetical protein
VAKTTPIWPRGGLATPIWPRGGSATPKGQSEKKEKKEKRRGLSLAIENMAERVQQIKEDVCLNLEQANDKYNAAANKKQRVKTFQEGDLVMAHLWKNCFPT